MNSLPSTSRVMPGIRRVILNHANSITAAKPLSHALLVLGLISLCLALYTLHNIHRQKQALMAERERLQQLQLAKPALSLPKLGTLEIKNSTKQTSEKNAELAEVNSARQELAMPWEPLFAMLESIQRPDVRILAIDPNAKKHTLKLTAEASSAEAMLAYLKTLGSQAILQDVVLQTHQYTADGRALPFSFMIEAAWLN